ncbi:hypothetical protein YN1_6350 [Nanoarchaeota archaeon]
MVIKIYLDISRHPFYESLIVYPPEEIEYININKKLFLGEYNKLSVYHSFKNNLFRKFISKIQYMTSIPRIKIIRKKYFDLYHSGRGVFVEGADYVMDLEYVTSPYSLHWDLSKRKISKFILRKLFLKSNLKFILPHSYSAMYSIKDFLGLDFFNKIKEKVEVLYPAEEPKVNEYKKLNKDKIILLFVASNIGNFIAKGGLEVLYTFLELRNKYDLELWIRSDVPNIIKEKYKNIIKFIPRINRNELFEIYKQSDIFVYPTYRDTWGYVLLEAMSTSLPIITSNTFAVPEIVKDYKNGLIIDVGKYKWNNGYLLNEEISKNKKIYWKPKKEIIERLKEKISELIEDKKLYEEISKNNLYEVINGRFSIKERNRKLKEIYESAVRK